jgi:TolB-like protein/class 3 adenylate cyclase/tetratricopeptide (TPR) repeat protein
MAEMPLAKAANVTDRVPDPRRLIAVVYADIVGYSRLIGLDDLGTLERLRELRRTIVDPALEEHGGTVVQTGGDSLLMVFNSIDAAVRFAVKVQQQIMTVDRNRPADQWIRYRIGINIGDAIADGTDLHGDAVNVVARLEAECPPGGICVSRAVRDHVHGRLDLDFRQLGPLLLKNIERPVEAFVVNLDPGARPTSGRRKGRAMIVGAGVAATALAGIFVWALLPRPHTDARPVDVATLAAPARLAERPSVAVLPLKNLSGDDAQNYFSDGITEDIITALGRFSNLIVIAQSASFRFKGSSASPAEIGRQLDARYLLGGSIRRVSDRVRVGVELTEAATGRLVWSETYDSEGRDIFTVQDDITKRVVGAAAVKLTRFEEARVLSKPTGNLAAYENVLRGRDMLSHTTRKSNDEATELFQRAIELDPDYADAYAALGGSYLEAVVSGWTEFRGEELERAESFAQKALALNPATTRAYRILGLVQLYRERYELALSQIDRALEINPSDTENFAYRGAILMWAGRASESLPWLEGALRFDRANSFTTARLCTAYYLLGRYSDAVATCDRSLSNNPGLNTQMVVHPILAATYAEMGRQQDANNERLAATRLWPLLDARTFAAQFGTEEAQHHVLEGLQKAGFR